MSAQTNSASRYRSQKFARGLPHTGRVEGILDAVGIVFSHGTDCIGASGAELILSMWFIHHIREWLCSPGT